ncbi:hypothetical protein L1987_37712 [Smallanthus sonchifolius]|uniref:Uncharacterized protein n=1 Tax=Smallanthus sonchifolius TaxID=185202 RepID=A0ACB9HGN6_9ASTR|nr:hypothetical protein L1987_37712 [Smallanthus sonchifolius]
MTVLKRYVLRLFMSIKYITANVVYRNNGRIVATASTVENSIKNSLECGRTCNAKAATVVGEVLAMRLKVEGLESGQERGIHVDVNKELEKKDFKNRTKVWAVINSLKNNGVKLILDESNDASHPGSKSGSRLYFMVLVVMIIWADPIFSLWSTGQQALLPKMRLWASLRNMGWEAL